MYCCRALLFTSSLLTTEYGRERWRIKVGINRQLHSSPCLHTLDYSMEEVLPASYLLLYDTVEEKLVSTQYLARACWTSF